MTTNDNLRGLLKEIRLMVPMKYMVRIDAALAAPDSGEVVMPERASRSNVDVILGALGMYGRVDFGQAVAIYNQALDDVAALNKAPAKAEPACKICQDLGTIGYGTSCSPMILCPACKEAPTDE